VIGSSRRPWCPRPAKSLARVCEAVGRFVPFQQRIYDELMCAKGGFDLGDLEGLQANDALSPALPSAAECLCILREVGVPLPAYFSTASGQATWLWQAARDGVLELVKGLRAEGCPWHEHTCEIAADGGEVEVLQWARGHGCPCGCLALPPYFKSPGPRGDGACAGGCGGRCDPGYDG